MHKLRDVLNSAIAMRRISYKNTSTSVFLVIFSVFITSIFLSIPTQAAQTVPYKLNFQGRLTNSSGVVVANGDYNMKLRLMSASSGGSNLWETTRTGSYKVTVTSGMFNIQLGDTVAGDPALSPAMFNTQTNATVYLEVELPTPLTATSASPTWDEGAMTPRQLISAAPYALNSDTIDGIDGASLAQLSTSNTFTGANLFKNTSNSTTAFQIQKSDSTPLLVADTQNLALKIGGGDVSPDASPALLVLDYKNTSGDPTGVNGAMYYNSNTSKFRCYENSEWKDCITTPLNLRNNYFYQNDFTFGSYAANSTVDSEFTMYAYYSTLTIATLAAEANHPGIARISIPTNTTSIGGFMTYSGSLPIRFGGGNARTALSNVRMSAISDAGATYVFRSGFINQITSGGTETGITNGCYFRYTNNLNGGRYQGVCRDNNVETASPCDTGVTPSFGGWDVLSVTINSAASVASFSVNGSNPCPVTTNIPTAASTGFGESVYKTGGTQARTIDVDYFEVRGTLQR